MLVATCPGLELSQIVLWLETKVSWETPLSLHGTVFLANALHPGPRGHTCPARFAWDKMMQSPSLSPTAEPMLIKSPRSHLLGVRASVNANSNPSKNDLEPDAVLRMPNQSLLSLSLLFSFLMCLTGLRIKPVIATASRSS